MNNYILPSTNINDVSFTFQPMPVSISTDSTRTYDQITKEAIDIYLNQQNLKCIDKIEFEALQNDLELLRTGYLHMYEALTGNKANSLLEALNGLYNLIQNKTTDEIVMEKARKEALKELGEVVDKL
jgi:hypothetical protein